MSKRKPPIGSRWRILAHDRGGAPLSVASADISGGGSIAGGTLLFKRTVFDELVIDDWFHLEQMSRDSWHLIIGDQHHAITIGKDGKPTITRVE